LTPLRFSIDRRKNKTEQIDQPQEAKKNQNGISKRKANIEHGAGTECGKHVERVIAD